MEPFSCRQALAFAKACDGEAEAAEAAASEHEAEAQTPVIRKPYRYDADTALNLARLEEHGAQNFDDVAEERLRDGGIEHAEVAKLHAQACRLRAETYRKCAAIYREAAKVAREKGPANEAV